MRCLSRLLLLLIPFLGIAALRDSFKKIEVDLPGKYRMGNIDFVYMINLDHRPQKFADASIQLLKYEICPYRVSAINGWELTSKQLDQLGLTYVPGMTPLMATCYPEEADGAPSYEFMQEYGKVYFCHHMAKGTIGCYLSHLSVLQHAYDAGYETIWVMEDDILVELDPWILVDLISHLDALVGRENWDVLFTDPDYRLAKGQYAIAKGLPKRPDFDNSYEERYSPRYTMQVDVSPHFRRIGARFGAYSMILRRSGIRKLLDFAERHKLFLAYDLDNICEMRRYACRYDVVTQVPVVDAITDNGQSEINE